MLEIDYDIYKEEPLINLYRNKTVYIIHYPLGLKISYSNDIAKMSILYLGVWMKQIKQIVALTIKHSKIIFIMMKLITLKNVFIHAYFAL